MENKLGLYVTNLMLVIKDTEEKPFVRELALEELKKISEDIGRFILAVNALPMPISDLSPKNPVILKNPPNYGFTLSKKIKPKNAVRCFANNGLKANTKRLGKYRIEIRLNGPFSKGRGRINCTMAGYDNRWRWLGRQFIIK